VGMAAALCKREKLLPRDVYTRHRVKTLQQELLKMGHYIPGIRLQDPQDIVHQATIQASSRLRLGSLSPDGMLAPLETNVAMLIPVPAGPMPTISFPVTCTQATQLQCELRTSTKRGNFTPDVVLEQKYVSLQAASVVATSEAVFSTIGTQRLQREDQMRAPGTLSTSQIHTVTLDFDVTIDDPCYVFICLKANPDVRVQYTRLRATGIKALRLQANGRSTQSSTKAR